MIMDEQRESFKWKRAPLQTVGTVALYDPAPFIHAGQATQQRMEWMETERRELNYALLTTPVSFSK